MKEKQLKEKSKHKENDIFKMDKNKKLFKVNDVLSLEYKNKTFRKYLKELDDAHNKISDLTALLKGYEESIREFIKHATSEDNAGNIDRLIYSLYSMLVINKYNNYNVVTLDEDGYIKSIEYIDGMILEHTEYPADILKGYYRIEDNKPIKDEDRFHQLYNQL